jgi:hypothetical protein
MRHRRSFFPRSTGRLVAPLVAGVLLVPTAAVAGPAPDVSRPPGVDSTSGNTAARWSAFVDQSGVAACVGPVIESRMVATLHIAVSDALNAVAPRSQSIAFRRQAPDAYARSAVASAARTSIVEVLRSAPRISKDCRRTSVDIVERAFETSMTALPDRPSVWLGVVLGNAAANASVSWTAQHPIESDLAPMRVARAEADSRDLSMWETASLLAACSTTDC